MGSSVVRMLACATFLCCGTSLAFDQLTVGDDWLIAQQVHFAATKPETREFFEKGELEHTQDIERSPREAYSYLYRADTRFKLGKLNSAFLDYDRAAQLAPKDARGPCGRARVCCEIRQYELAIDDATEAIRLDRTRDEAFLVRGKSHFGLKHYDKAAEDLSKYLGGWSKSEQIAIWSALGVARLRVGQYHGAIEAFNTALKGTPYDDLMREQRDDPRLHLFRGVAHLYARELDKAIADFDHVIRFCPDEPETYGYRALAFALNGDVDRMLADCRMALSLPLTAPCVFDVPVPEANVVMAPQQRTE